MRSGGQDPQGSCPARRLCAGHVVGTLVTRAANAGTTPPPTRNGLNRRFAVNVAFSKCANGRSLQRDGEFDGQGCESFRSGTRRHLKEGGYVVDATLKQLAHNNFAETPVGSTP